MSVCVCVCARARMCMVYCAVCCKHGVHASLRCVLLCGYRYTYTEQSISNHPLGIHSQRYSWMYSKTVMLDLDTQRDEQGKQAKDVAGRGDG